MVRLTVVIPFLFLVACVCTYPSKTPDNEELYDDRNNINNQSLSLRRQPTYNYNNNGSGSVGQTQNTSITQHFGDINYGNNATSEPAHIVNIDGGLANGGASYGSGNGGNGGFSNAYGGREVPAHQGWLSRVLSEIGYQ
ncbi:FK506-binding protein 5-like [Spodoptera frugiperda]|uniref:FK506-binding protein 5-like n=1 Tax=Spodoptera frugiperda TaxID=7108 RepID=A0A9R0EQF3_SPOFR|nr:FK506-binding protein 5-like [Spodoptera frugiperda]